MVLKVLLTAFLSGGIFLFTLYELLGVPFKFDFKKVIVSVLISLVFNFMTNGIHYGYMGLSKHIWFDNISMCIFAVLFACIIAVAFLFLPSKAVRRILLGKKSIRKARIVKRETLAKAS